MRVQTVSEGLEYEIYFKSFTDCIVGPEYDRYFKSFVDFIRGSEYEIYFKVIYRLYTVGGRDIKYTSSHL